MLKRIKVGELIMQKKAHSQTGPFGTQLKASDYVNEGTPVINVRNIGFGDIRPNQLEYVDEEMSKELKSHKLRKYDIVFGRKGAVERHSLISSKEEGWIQGSDCIRLRFLTQDFDPTFISYFFKTEYHKQWMINHGSFGATMGSLNQEIISKIEIPDVPIRTQYKIATILSAYDKLIENNNQRIKLLEEMAEEMYKEWFVRLRFPGYELAKFFNSKGDEVAQDAIGALPEGWVKMPINSFVNIISGYAFKTESFDCEGDYKLVTIKNVQDGYFVTETTDYIHELPKNLKDDCKLKDKDIILSLTGNIGRICMVYGDNYLLNQRVAKLKPKEKYFYEFTYLMFKSRFIRATLENLSNGAAQQNLSPVEMGQLEFPLPDSGTLQGFSTLTSSFFDEIIVLYKKNQLLQQTRDLLIPRLISGKLSVEHLVEEEENLSIAAESQHSYGKN